MINNVVAQKKEEQERQANIFIAARDNDLQELDLALKQGQRLDLTIPQNGHTPLHTAALWGNLEFIRAAVAHESANVWARDRRGRLAYDHASDRNAIDVMKLLYDAMYPAGGAPLPPPSEPDEP